MRSSAGCRPRKHARRSLFVDGDACYDAVVAAIGSARHHVHLEYYIFRDDPTGMRIINALAERARAGVEVRLLADAVGERIGAPQCASCATRAWRSASSTACAGSAPGAA